MKIGYVYISLIYIIFTFNSCKTAIADAIIEPNSVEKDTTDTYPKDTVLNEVKQDIESLYFLRDSDNYPKHRVNYYEVKNTKDTYYLERAGEVSFKVKYSPSGEIMKFENPWLEGDYMFNEWGLPMAQYDEKFLKRAYFYNEKRLLVKIKEYNRWVKEFLREYSYEYDEKGRLKKFIDNVSSGELKENTTIDIYSNLVVATNSANGVIIKELNTQQLPVKFRKNDIVYSGDNNVVTAKVLNEDKSVFYYYTVSFDENSKPTIPNYSETWPYQHFDNMIISSLLNYARRNPIKIVEYKKKFQGEFREYLVTNYTYKYNSQQLPTEIYKVQERKEDGGMSLFSKQLLKIGYEE